MKRFTEFSSILVGFVILLTSFGNSQTIPDFDWSIKGSGSLRDVAYSVTVDPIGNVYAIGEFFSASINFPGLTLTGAGTTGNCDYFLVKFNPYGHAIWGSKGGGSLTDRGYGVALDQQGNLFSTGHYFGQAIFGSYTLNSSGNLDCFTAKLDTAGNYIWMKEGKSVSQVSTRNMAVDANGNVIIVGYYGSATVDSVRFDSVKITTNGARDIFVVKYNNDGAVQWGVTGGGSSSGEQANSVTVDAAGNIYVTGIYSDSATFSGTVLNGNGGTEIFVVKYNSNGQLVWARSAGGLKTDDGSGIALDGLGHLYVAGRFDSAATFGSTNLLSAGGYDAFLAKYDTSGNLIWVKIGGGAGEDYLKDIECDSQGNILGTGYFTTQATFGTVPLTAVGGRDVFFIKYNPAGDVIWAKKAGGSDSDEGNRVCIDLGNNLISTGFFSTTAYFGADTLTSSGVQDVFVSKIGNNPVPAELISFEGSLIGNKINLKWKTASELNNYGFEIEKSTDNFVFNKIVFVNGKGTSTSNHEYEFNDYNFTSSKYYYRLKQIDFDGTFTYSNTIEVNVSLPSDFALYQNYPNPFNPASVIGFDLPAEMHVNLNLFNSVGELISVLAEGNYSAGRYKVQMNASTLASGVYFYKLTAVKADGTLFSEIKKMMLIR